ncbi:MAG: hypothetical protein K6348_06760 [Deferribacterales bacterium]
MRITFNMMSLKYLQNLQNSLTKMTDANDKVTKGRTLLTPETNVVSYVSAINVQRTIDEYEQFAKNAENAENWLSNYDNELQRAFDIIRNSKNNYAIAGVNAAQNNISRKALAGDVYNMLQSLVDVGNANYFGRYFFAGYNTDTKPFAADKREVSSVKINGATDADIIKRGVFADLNELKEGNYKIQVDVNGEYVTISLFDSKGAKILIDSNGSDESAKSGNLATTELKVKFKPGEVINLGVGIAVKLPSSNTSFHGSFYFKPGDDINYFGDDGVITTKIGYQQDVDINFTGKEVFTEVERILKGTRYNTIKGLAITETTKFSEIDGANISTADYIEISGTDHNGLTIGTAKIRGIENVTLDLTNTTNAERTFNITYAGRTESISLDARNYKNIDDIVFSIKREIESVGWSKEIEVIADGDKLLFSTTRSGNAVKLAISSDLNNKLGLATSSEATGKDTAFEYSFNDFSKTSLNTSFSGITSSNAITLYIDNNYITIPSSAGRTVSALATQINTELTNQGLNNIYYALVDGSNLKIEKMNINFTNDSALRVYIDDNTGTPQYKTDNARGTGYPFATEKMVGDLLRFIEDLYDNSVEAKIVDGYISIKDKRGGLSRLSVKINPSNSGIGYPEVDKDIILKGKYTGGFDDEWTVQVSAGNTITVTDASGNQIKTLTIPANYHGEELDLGYGVKMILPDLNIPHTFSVKLKASSSLSFGDMNIIQEGKNVNTFRSLKNLYDALNLDIPQEGIGAPSAWRDENFKSTMNPHLDGTFRGNYNDEWKYEVQSKDKQTSFYLQKELSTFSLEDINSSLGTNVNFAILLKDKDGNISETSFNSININNIVTTINTTMMNQGVKAEILNNRLVVRSGNGLQEIELNPLDNISSQILGYSRLYDHDNNPLTPEQATPFNTIFNKTAVNLNLAESTDEQRTITFNYHDGTNWQQSSIKITKRDYSSLDDLITEINNNISLPAGITAVKVGNNLAFQYTGTVQRLLVTGDHEGTLGFFKKGDEIKLKVTNTKGELVNELTFDTANKLKDVADGVKLAFDAGIAYATDSFTSTVGSGINYEIGILDKAENQINEKLTIAGTRINRAESVINFKDTVKTGSETIKAKFLGSTAEDATASITEFQLAQQAYQAALATSAKIMQLSILDYIR